MSVRAFEQSSGEWTWPVGARAKVVKGIHASVHTRDRDPQLSVLQIIRNNEIIRDRVTRAEGLVQYG